MSLFSPQKLTTKQNATTTALQPYAGAYKQLLTRGLDVSNTAYNPATNAGVAGFAAPEEQAFGVAQNNLGSYQPWMQAAGLSALSGSTPTYQTVGNYMNPFTQNVTDALLNNYQSAIGINRQQSMSDAARAGALTGDRRYIAQANAEQPLNQALAQNLAQVQQRGYETALGAAQSDAGRGLEAAQIFGNLGGNAQQYGYTDVNALLGIGGLQRELEQKRLDTATENAKRESAYPFETANWAANYATGLGNAAGSRSTGKTVAPGPSIGQQVIGAIAAGVGAAAKGGMGAKDGGAIHGYAQGGGTPFFGGLSYVPQTQMQTKGLSPAQFVSPARTDSGMNKMLESFNAAHGTIKGLGGINSMFKTPATKWTNPDTGEETQYYDKGFIPWLKNQASNAYGGLSNLADNIYSGVSSGLGNLSSYLPSFGFNHGGVVRHGYQFGGAPDAIDYMNSPFDYLHTSYVPDNSSFNNPTSAVLGKDAVSPESFYNSGVVPRSEAPTRIVGTPPVPPDAEPLITGSTSEGLGGLTSSTPPEEDKGGSLFGFKFSPEAADALMAAGFGMMASNSPFPLQAAGEGGLAGLGYYARAMKDKREREAGKVMEVGGNIVKVTPDNKIETLYRGPKPAFKSIEKADDGSLIGITENGMTQVIYKGTGGSLDKTPAGRAQLAESFNLKPGSPEHTMFVLTGKLPDKQKFSEGDTKYAGYSARMASAEQNLDKVLNTDIIDPETGKKITYGKNRTSKFDPSDLSEKLKSDIPVIGGYLISEQRQLYEQAAREWIAALLRKDSGAAITDSEFSTNYKTYFPQPGDTLKVQEQKRQARVKEQRNFALLSNGAYSLLENQNPTSVPSAETGTRIGEPIPLQKPGFSIQVYKD